MPTISKAASPIAGCWPKRRSLRRTKPDPLIQGLSRSRRRSNEGIQFRRQPGRHPHAIEARLVEEVGKAAQKLHTARSRNDQVALDVRLYLRDETIAVIVRLVRAIRARSLSNWPRRISMSIMPGYTHLQRAQPVLLSHHLMAYYEMFTRDAERFQTG